MALQLARLTEVAYVASSAGSIYANPASTKTLVKGLLFHNTNNINETVQVYVVPDSSGSVGTATAAMRIFYLTIASNETVVLDIPFALLLIDTNDTIQAVTTTGSKVTCLVFGDKDV